MCILALAWQAHPRWLFVVAANRDEYHERPSAPLARWDETSDLIAGRDLRSGGTWLGVSEAGRFSAVTNLSGFGAPDPTCTSRGALVTDLLAHDEQHDALSHATLARFNPFNAIALDSAALRFLSNRPEPQQRHLGPGIYAMSNGPFDQPWPKALRLKDRLVRWATKNDSAEALLDDLFDDTPLGGTSPHASVFVRDPIYGTRCSTVVAVDAIGRGLVIERSYSPESHVTGEVTLSFDWQVGRAGATA